MSDKTAVCLSCLLAIATIGMPANAQRVRPISDAQAVAMAIARNPDLRIALLALRQAEHAVIAEEDRYAPILQLDGGVTRLASPSLSAAGGVTESSTESIVLGQQISKTFPWGSAVSFRLEEERTSRTAQVFIGSEQEVTLGPGYSILGRLALVQPLIRGFGTEFGEAELRAAQLSRTAAEHARDRAASELVRAVLSSYWELWYAGAAQDIERTARALAERQLEDARARIARGAGAPVDVYTFEARVAELDEAVLTAQVERQRRAMELARSLGVIGAGATGWVASAEGVPAPPPAPSEQAVVKRALVASPELRELQARVALARDRVKSAGEADRPRLDLEGYVQAEGLGNQEVVPALEQFGTLGAVSAHVGLTFEMPLGSDRREAALAGAELEAEIAGQELRSARQRVESEARLALLQERAARDRLVLAEKTLSFREQQLEATRKRFAIGDAIPLEVLEAEESVRRARLRVTRARVDLVLAEIARAHLTGELLARYRRLVAAPPRSPAGWLVTERARF